MAHEVYADYATTTVGVGGYTSGSGVLNVAATASFPATGNFRVSVQDPTVGTVKVILKVTAVNSSTQFAVTAEGTDANALASDAVTLLITSGALDALFDEMNQFGTFASLPASGYRKGHRYTFTDSIYDYALWDGSAWRYFCSGFGELVPPPTSSWTFDNTGTSTVDSTNGYLHLFFDPGAGAVTIRSYYRTAPVAAYTLTVAMRCLNSRVENSGPTNTVGYGVAFREGGTGKYVTYWINNGDGNSLIDLRTDKWAATNSYSANYRKCSTVAALPYTQLVANPLSWFRITDDLTTNVTFSHSMDGQHWTLFDTRTRTDYLASTGPTQIGVFAYVNGDSARLDLVHWALT